MFCCGDPLLAAGLDVLVVVDVDGAGAVVAAVDNEGEEEDGVVDDDACAVGLVDFVVVLECVALGDEDDADVAMVIG